MILIRSLFTFFSFSLEVDLETTETPIFPNLKKDNCQCLHSFGIFFEFLPIVLKYYFLL